MATARRPDPAAFIAANTRLRPVPSIPEIRLHTAHEATGLWRLASPGPNGVDPPPPYWAFPWAGGLALARHIIDHPETVAGRHVLDLGAGSGLVAIAAALAGAASVLCSEVDPFGVAATRLNAAANGVQVEVLAGDLTGAGPPARVDLVLVGDLFYDQGLARRVTAFLDRCLAAGLSVLVGDPGRSYLPQDQLRRLEDYAVPDVGEVEAKNARRSAVFAFIPLPLRPSLP
jgi:predicted nicotinamide N-methyase